MYLRILFFNVICKFADFSEFKSDSKFTADVHVEWRLPNVNSIGADAEVDRKPHFGRGPDWPEG